jgi:hypothetical protein
MNGKFQALSAPPTALEKGGVEVLRAAVVDGGLHVSLQRAFDEPDIWGVLLADLACHVARIYSAEVGADEEETMARVRAMFDAELDMPTDPGVTSAVS